MIAGWDGSTDLQKCGLQTYFECCGLYMFNETLSYQTTICAPAGYDDPCKWNQTPCLDYVSERATAQVRHRASCVSLGSPFPPRS